VPVGGVPGGGDPDPLAEARAEAARRLSRTRDAMEELTQT